MKVEIMIGGEEERRQSVPWCVPPPFTHLCVCGFNIIVFWGVFFFTVTVPQPQNKAAGVQGGVVRERRLVEEQLVQGGDSGRAGLGGVSVWEGGVGLLGKKGEGQLISECLTLMIHPHQGRGGNAREGGCSDLGRGSRQLTLAALRYLLVSQPHTQRQKQSVCKSTNPPRKRKVL